MGDGEIWVRYGMVSASIAAGEVARLELGEMFVDAMEAAPGDRFPLGRVTPANKKAFNCLASEPKARCFTSLPNDDGGENTEVRAVGTRRCDGRACRHGRSAGSVFSVVVQSSDRRQRSWICSARKILWLDSWRLQIQIWPLSGLRKLQTI
jgi:hypothetical protein